MANSSPDTPTRAASTTHTPSNDSSTATTATATPSTWPQPMVDARPLSHRLILPPPSPNTPSSPLRLPSKSAHKTPVCSSTAAISSITAAPLSVHLHSTTMSALAPSPRSLKLQSQISTLQSQIATTQTSLDDTLANLQVQLSTTTANHPPGSVSASPQSEPDSQAQAEAIVKRHIKLLHTYNEIKDVGQGLMGLIADARGVRLKEVMEEMGFGKRD